MPTRLIHPARGQTPGKSVRSDSETNLYSFLTSKKPFYNLSQKVEIFQFQHENVDEIIFDPLLRKVDNLINIVLMFSLRYNRNYYYKKFFTFPIQWQMKKYITLPFDFVFPFPFNLLLFQSTNENSPLTYT